MFQRNALAGALFTAGVAVGGGSAIWMATAGVLGSLTGAVVARVLRFDRTEWSDGVHGFNPALVGMATFFFFKPSAHAAWLFVGSAVVATLLAAVCRRYVPVPVYTTPFVVCTWALHAVGIRLGLDPVAWHAPVAPGLHIGEAVIEGLSEVMLTGGNPYTGLIFLAGIAVSNWRHAVLAALGAAVGAALAVYRVWQILLARRRIVDQNGDNWTTDRRYHHGPDA
jgi:urea transporter